MQIREDIYNWLVSLKVIPNEGRKLQEKVEISKQLVSGFETGLLFSKLLKELYNLFTKTNNRPATPMTKLDTLKEVNSAAARLYNWNILVDEFKKINISVDQDTKGLILSGDTEMMHELFKEIYSSSISWSNTLLKQSQSLADVSRMDDSSMLRSQRGAGAKSVAQMKIQSAQQQVDLSKLDPKRDLNQTHNCLEFFIVAVAKHLQLTMKQAASLFTNNNKYLAQVIAKGVKGVFEPIVSLYQEIYANSSQLIKLFLEDASKKSLSFALQALKPGLVSKSFDVAQWTARLYSKLGSDLVDNNLILAVWDWFLNEEGGGLVTSLLSIRRHPDLRDLIVNMILQFAKNNFVEVFTLGIRKASPDTRDLICALEQIFKPMSEHPISRDELVSSGIVDEWLELSLNVAEGDFKYPIDVRISALSFGTEIWCTYPQKVEEIENKANQLISLLKKGSRDKSQSLTLMSLSNMFKLLNHFGQTRNSYAPLIYKTLALSLIENHSNSISREFILHNFIQTFQRLETIPFNIVVEPLVKQVQVSENVTYIINVYDMQFFQYLANNERLGVKNSIQLLDLLAKIFLNNSVYAGIAQDIIVSVLQRHIENQTMQEFVLKFIKIALAMFYASEKKKRPKDKLQQAYGNKVKGNAQVLGNPELEYEVIQAQKRGQIVEITRTIIQLSQTTLNDRIKPLVAHTNLQIKQFSKKNSKGMLVLLSLFGNPEKVMEQYESELKEHQAQIQNQEEQQGNSLILDNQIRSVEDSVKKYSMSKGKSKLTKEEQQHLASLRQPKTDPKVLNELEAIKKSFNDKVNLKVSAIEEQKETTEKQKQQLRKQLELRSLEQGISNLNKKDLEVKLIFREGQREKSIKTEKKQPLIDFELTDLTLEEDRERVMVEYVLKRFNKLFKFMFVKYANTSHLSKKTKDFEEYQEKIEAINYTEMWFFIKDFQLDIHVNKEEIPALFRAISLNILKDKTELKNLTFDGFKHFLVQFSILIFGRTQKNNKKYLSPYVTLQRLLNHMRQAYSAKGQSTQLFDDPEQQFFQDSEVIKEYNKKLQEDPKFPLPEGYKTIKEPKIEFQYNLLEGLKLKESQAVAYEVLNSILYDILQVNIIEPIQKQEFIIVCRPNMLGYVKSKVTDRLQNGQLSQSEAQIREKKELEEKEKRENDLKKQKEYEKQIRERAKQREKQKLEGKKEVVDTKYTKQLVERYTQSAGQPQQVRKTLEIDSFHKFTVGMRLGISKVPYKDRGIAEQVAIVLDDLLQAVETGKKTISRQIPIMNKIRLEQEKIQQMQDQQKEQKKLKYKQQQDFIKQRMDELKKQKEQDKVMNADKTKADKEAKKVEKIKKKEQREKYLESLKKKLEDQKKNAEDERVKKEIEDKEKRLKDLEQKKADFSRFNREQIEKFREEKKIEKEAKKSEEQKKQEKSEKDAFILEKLKELIEKKGEVIKSKEKEVHTTINSKLQQPEYVQILEKSNFKLSYLFELLQLEFYKPIEYADNKDFIPLQIWMWFGERFKIFPEIVSRVEYVRIFNYLTHKKTKNPNSKAPVGIDYLEFLNALMRISIKGAKVFNRIAEKIAQKQNPTSEDMNKMANEENGQEEEEVQDDEVQIKRQHQTRDYMMKDIKRMKENQIHRLQELEQRKKEEKQLEQQALLLDNYRYLDITTPQTLNALIYYLLLPEDKIGIELRFRMVMEDSQQRIATKKRKKELIDKLESDLEKWSIDHKLPRTKSPKKKKPQKLFDPYGNTKIPDPPKEEEEQQQEEGLEQEEAGNDLDQGDQQQGEEEQ